MRLAHAGPSLRCQSANQCAESLGELAVQFVRRDVHRVVLVHDLPGQLDVTILFQCPRDRVQVDHHLYEAARLVSACLDVGEVGLARQRC